MSFIVLLTQPAVGQAPAVDGWPATLPGTLVPALQAPEPPETFAWTIPLPAAPMTSPILTSDLVVVAYRPGTVAAYSRADEREVWRKVLNPAHPLATDGTLVFVAEADAIHALRAADGVEAWRVPAEALTAPLLVKDGWIIAATAGKLTAWRATDGGRLWTTDAGVQREVGAIAGDLLFTPLVDGWIVARNLLNGEQKWKTALGGRPQEPLVVGEDIFVGAAQKLYCLDAATGEIDSDRVINVRAQVRGRAATDGNLVFYTAVDNMVRAVDRTNGAQRWQEGVKFRPFGGPSVAGGSVFVVGRDRLIPALLARDGSPAGGITVPSKAHLTVSPGFVATPDGAVFAVITGGLDESWALSLSLPVGAPAVRPSR